MSRERHRRKFAMLALKRGDTGRMAVAWDGSGMFMAGSNPGQHGTRELRRMLGRQTRRRDKKGGRL